MVYFSFFLQQLISINIGNVEHHLYSYSMLMHKEAPGARFRKEVK